MLDYNSLHDLTSYTSKRESVDTPTRLLKTDAICISLDTVPQHDVRTDGRTDWQKWYVHQYRALHHKPMNLSTYVVVKRNDGGIHISQLEMLTSYW